MDRIGIKALSPGLIRHNSHTLTRYFQTFYLLGPRSDPDDGQERTGRDPHEEDLDGSGCVLVLIYTYVKFCRGGVDSHHTVP